MSEEEEQDFPNVMMTTLPSTYRPTSGSSTEDGAITPINPLGLKNWEIALIVIFSIILGVPLLGVMIKEIAKMFGRRNFGQQYEYFNPSF